MQEAGAGSDVSLEIIHLGKHKTVRLKLSAQPTRGLQGKFDWKYPLEPEIVQSWRPGKIFRLKSGDKDWIEIDIPEFEVNLESSSKSCAEEALQDARKSSKAEEPTKKSHLHWLRPPFQLRDYFKDLYRPKRPQTPPFEQGNDL